MATIIRPEISAKNKYWISKHRYYELKHFCLQYPTWKKEYAELDSISITSSLGFLPTDNLPGDPTLNLVMKKTRYSDLINIVEKAAKEADEFLYEYILKAVTEELSFTYLKSKLNIPCGRDMYYDRYRRFFWLLSNIRD